MKTNYLLILSIITAMFFSSCIKDETNVTEPISEKIENKSYEEQVAYAHKHLLAIGSVLSKYSNNLNFLETVYPMIHLKSKNDNSAILIRDIISVSNKRGMSFINQKDVSILENSINAFKDIEGIDWQPQLYIPEFDRQYKNFLNRSFDPDKPVIVPFVVEEPNDVYEGYQEYTNGELQPIEESVDETFAQQNDVWIISINEDMALQAVLPNPIPIDYDIYEYSIDKMTIKKHYESWAAGKSEVAIRGYRYYTDGGCHGEGDPNNECSRNGANTTNSYQGILIRKFSRSEVNNQDEITVDFVFEKLQKWSYNAIPIVCCNVIFESDAWPTGKKEDFFPINNSYGSNSIKHIEYRSSDNSYFGDKSLYSKVLDPINETDIQNYSEDDSDMKFNLYLSNVIEYP